MRRKVQLVVGEIYHIYNTSIAGFNIFNSNREYSRIKNMIKYYQVENMPLRFSDFIGLENVKKDGFNNHFISASKGKDKLVQIIAYCTMPTHLHLILKQLIKDGISTSIGNILNSYSRYFNTKHRRKGPLWEGKFKNVLVKTDEQLLHLTRYIHLNPVTEHLVDKPEDWPDSSYREYLLRVKDNERICEYDDLLDIKPTSYKKFVDDRISYQRDLAKIKRILLEET